MQRVVIKKSSANPMQSGRARISGWKISFFPQMGQYIDPLMGWTGSNHMLAELTLHFHALEEAIRYVQAQGWDYTIDSVETVTTSAQGVPHPKRYADNFLSPRLR